MVVRFLAKNSQMTEGKAEVYTDLLADGIDSHKIEPKARVY